MKLQFKIQDFQTDAVNAVADLFLGSEHSETTFSVTKYDLINESGTANQLKIPDDVLLENLHAAQKRNNLPQTDDGEKQYSIEMETGTGKTYVYTKTIFELHKRYHFSKFIIVVPSVAIREGVCKSLQITEEHFALSYDRVPCRYFIYNSAKLSDVRRFATSGGIEIMIINIDAFRKAENVINQAQDKLNGDAAIQFIQETNPIVIIDEPQSVDNTPKAKEAIASLNPLVVLRYSATHRELKNLLYRLTPVDAYQRKLVKQICVSSSRASGGFNQPYIKLLEVSNDKGFRAKLEIDVQDKEGHVSRKTVTVKPDSDLYLLSKEREIYENYQVAGIDCTPGLESIEFTNTERIILGHAIGDVDEMLRKREQIRRTIETHLEKELRLNPQGIKVLSLFFIDEVQKYRQPDGSPGIYAAIFEECYAELIAQPRFARLKFPAGSPHNGYFSQDKKGNYKNTKGDTQDDYDTYNTIMKDKEWLLSFECPLRFIFSHSALKEGWDNPNVFQVCTLIDQKSVFTCRQKIGRGLRLCVDQEGKRIEDPNINILHVMADESFADFADKLQKELEHDTGMRFGVLEIGLFTDLEILETVVVERTPTREEAEQIVASAAARGPVEKEPEEKGPKIPAQPPVQPAVQTVEQVMAQTMPLQTVVKKKITYEDAQQLMTHMEQKGYISKTGRVKETLKNALMTGTLDLPAKFEAARDRFEQVIRHASCPVPLRDASRDVTVHLKKQVLLSPEFLELWNRIKQKTTYRVKVDTEKLVAMSLAALQNMPKIAPPRIVTQTAQINIENAGVSHTEQSLKTFDIKNVQITLPDLLAVLGEQTMIKRETLCRILTASGRLGEFISNPQGFIEAVGDILRNIRHELAIDGISYKRLAGEEYYVQEIFDSAELIANLDRNAVAANHSVYDYIVYDSATIERPFAEALDRDDEVKLFFKIPPKFKVETPIGDYNPDWAVLLEKDGSRKLYFILETKGSTNLDMDVRKREHLKINCGERHFASLANDIEQRSAKSWTEFKKMQ